MALAVATGVGPSTVGAAPVPAFAQSGPLGLDAAQAYVDQAALSRAGAEERLVAARDEVARVSAAIDELTGGRREVVDRMGQAQQRASRLAVDAYMHGGSANELRLLDAGQATRAALRLHLSTGRIAQAREAAAQLLSMRDQVDDELAGRAEELARATQAVLDAERDLAEAIGAELYAAALLAEAEAAAAAERAAQAEAEAEAERLAAKADEEAAAEREETAEDDVASGGTGGSTAAAPTPYDVGVPVHTDPWERLRQCESGGNYQSKSNPLYRGAYQFGWSTWESVGGTGDPADAPPAEQDARAYALYLLRGWSPWPVCGAGLPPG